MSPERQVSKAFRVSPEQRVAKVFRVNLERQVAEVFRVSLERPAAHPDRPDRKAQPAGMVRTVSMVCLAARASPVPGAPAVRPVR